MGLTDALLLDPYPFEIWIAQRSDGQKGTGTLNDPYDGTTAAKFDGIMSALPGPTCVHLGPGEFQTAGYRVDAVGWQIKPGMRILGSGIDVTILKLVNASTAGQYFVIGHQLTTGSGASEVKNPVDFCEVADMTIDCDLGNQSGTQIACGAVRLMGNHVRIRRVKAINWGTKDSTKCFAFQLITGVEHASDRAGSALLVGEPINHATLGNGTGGRADRLSALRRKFFRIITDFRDLSPSKAVPVTLPVTLNTTFDQYLQATYHPVTPGPPPSPQLPSRNSAMNRFFFSLQPSTFSLIPQ